MFLKNCERSLRRSSFVRNEKQPLTAGYFRKVLLSSGAELTACNKVIIAEQTHGHCHRQCRCPPSHVPSTCRICPSVRVLRRSARTLREIVSAYRERNLLDTFLHQKKAGIPPFVVRKILAFRGPMLPCSPAREDDPIEGNHWHPCHTSDRPTRLERRSRH